MEDQQQPAHEPHIRGLEADFVVLDEAKNLDAPKVEAIDRFKPEGEWHPTPDAGPSVECVMIPRWVVRDLVQMTQRYAHDRNVGLQPAQLLLARLTAYVKEMS